RSLLAAERSRRGGISSLPDAPAVPSVELAQCPFTLLAVAFLPVANASFECRQEVEGDIRRLKVLALCLRDVVDKRTKRRRSWCRRRLAAGCHRGRIQSRHQAGRNR